MKIDEIYLSIYLSISVKSNKNVGMAKGFQHTHAKKQKKQALLFYLSGWQYSAQILLRNKNDFLFIYLLHVKI